MKNSRRLLGPAVLIVFFGSRSYAEEPLFLQQVNAAKPDAEAISKAKKQVKDHKDIKIRDDVSLVPFHQQLDQQLLPTKAYCNNCHLPVPHSKILRNRSFLNMHTQYIACEACHFRPQDKELTYQWFDYDSKTAANEIDGRFYSGRKKDDKSLRVNRNGLVKIAPFYQNEPALITESHEFADKVAKQWENADVQSKAKLKAKIHQPLEKKGPDCEKCHTDKQGLFELTDLGASADQIKAIQKNTIADFFKHYKPEKKKNTAEKKKEQRIRITDLLK